MVTVIQKTTDSKEAVRRKWRLRDVVRIPAGDQHGPLGLGRIHCSPPSGEALRCSENERTLHQKSLGNPGLNKIKKISLLWDFSEPLGQSGGRGECSMSIDLS